MKEINRKSNDRVQVFFINVTAIALIIVAVILVIANFNTTIDNDEFQEAYQAEETNEYVNNDVLYINRETEGISGNKEENTTDSTNTEATDKDVEEETTASNNNLIVGEVAANDNGVHGSSYGMGMYDNGLHGNVTDNDFANKKYNNVASGKLNKTQRVDDDYFDNTVFMGDSRTVAMQALNLVAPEDTFAVNGINHVDYMSQQFYDEVTGVNGTIFDIVAQRQPEKIYVALGVNGVAFMQKATFLETYIEMIERLMKASPNSKIIIESILPVNEETYNRGNPNMNNINVDDMNRELLSLANIKEIYYLDLSNVLKDENNRLASKYDCGDGIHFTNAGYEAIYNEMCYYGVD